MEAVLNWLDAISIGAFCVIGANNGLRAANGEEHSPKSASFQGFPTCKA